VSGEVSAARHPALLSVRVEFGDCDPARIVYFPNYFRWADAASRHYFEERGLPRWEETERTHGIIGTPCVHAEGRFIAPASYGDLLVVQSQITEWRNKSFVFRHWMRRDGEDIAQIDEVRVFARRLPGAARGIQAVEVPPEWRPLLAG
jgi:4-hydroxybenzoyl-CoA thioesterase